MSSGGRGGSGATSSTISAPESRVNVLLRLVGVLFFAIGASITYLTYDSVASGLASQLAPVFYLCAAMLMIVGLVAVVSRYE